MLFWKMYLLAHLIEKSSSIWLSQQLSLIKWNAVIRKRKFQYPWTRKVHWTYVRLTGRLLHVLCMFNLRSVSRGWTMARLWHEIFKVIDYNYSGTWKTHLVVSLLLGVPYKVLFLTEHLGFALLSCIYHQC